MFINSGRLSQRIEISRFRVRINSRLCDKLDQRRTAVDRQNLLLDRSRETPGRTYERVQRFPGECRRESVRRKRLRETFRPAYQIRAVS